MAQRILHTCDFLLTMADISPVADGAVVVDERGTILAAGRRSEIEINADTTHHHQILMPGVLNCHVHLTDVLREEPVPCGAGLNSWVRNLMAARGTAPTDDELAEGIVAALATMRKGGTVAVGEVANNTRTIAGIQRSGMQTRFIHELIGFAEGRAEGAMSYAEKVFAELDWNTTIRHALGAHAPYSVSPQLMQGIDTWAAQHRTYVYQHLAEDPAERMLYETGDGPWRDYLQEIEAWEPNWKAPGVSPIEFYDKLGILTNRFVAVHLADATPEELMLLAARGCKAVLSPTSNVHITGRVPRMWTILEHGMTFAFGTDGRGSNPHIDVFQEASLLLEFYPDTRAGVMLQALTRSGAQILQFERSMGEIAAGKQPGLISVEIANATDDLWGLERGIIMYPIRRERVA